MARAKSRSTASAAGGSKPSSAKRASASSANSSTRPSAKACDNDNGTTFGNAGSCPLVLIEWEDSAQPIPGWSYLSSFESPGTIRCASVGWLIHDDAQVKALAPNMGGDDNSAQVSGVIQIPTRCIVKVTRLQEPPLTCA